MPGSPTFTRSTVPSIRTLVDTLATQSGVQAAMLVGHDGLVIASRTSPDVDDEHLAAHVPTLVAAAEELGSQASRGGLVTAVLEYERGIAILSSLTPDAVLLVLLHGGANVGPLLFELRRFRSRIAAIVV